MVDLCHAVKEIDQFGDDCGISLGKFSGQRIADGFDLGGLIRPGFPPSNTVGETSCRANQAREEAGARRIPRPHGPTVNFTPIGP